MICGSFYRKTFEEICESTATVLGCGEAKKTKPDPKVA